MAGDSHDGLVSRPGFRQLSNECMSQIMEPRRNLSFSTDAVPGRLETGDRLRRINLTVRLVNNCFCCFPLLAHRMRKSCRRAAYSMPNGWWVAKYDHAGQPVTIPDMQEYEL
jgi:hypothetical protein